MGTLLNQINTPFTLSLQKKPIACKKWTKKDLRTLKRLADDFSTLKDIAKRMNRTPASINTALDRYDLRIRKYTKLNKSHSSILFRTSKPMSHSDTELTLKSDLPIQTDLAETINWLIENGTRVLPTTYRLSTDPQARLYYVNGQLMPPYGLVIEANKQRLLLKLPVFHVNQITE